MDLSHDADCDRRNLLRSNSDARRVLSDYIDLYDDIMNLSAAYEDKILKLEDVCQNFDSKAGVCEVESQF